MRTRAEIDILALLEEAELLVLGKILYKLHLIRLVFLLHELDSLGSREGESLKLEVLLYYLFHLSLKSGDILV